MQNSENEKEQARIRQEIATLNQKHNEIVNDPSLSDAERSFRINRNEERKQEIKDQLADLQKKQNQLQTQQDYRRYEQQAMLRSQILRAGGDDRRFVRTPQAGTDYREPCQCY